jgi:hypothetical protein
MDIVLTAVPLTFLVDTLESLVGIGWVCVMSFVSGSGLPGVRTSDQNANNKWYLKLTQLVTC